MDHYEMARRSFDLHASTFVKQSSSRVIVERRVKETFGVSSHVGAMALYRISRAFGLTYCPVDKMLIGLRWLKVYATESNDAFFFHMDEKSIRKWRRVSVSALASLDLVRCFMRFVETRE
jgi:hypothetical protein